MQADSLRDRVERYRYLQTHGAPYRAPRALELTLKQEAARLGPADDPAGLSPPALVGALLFAELAPEREAECRAALAAVPAEQWAAGDPFVEWAADLVLKLPDGWENLR
jgi:hypothetical protein